MNARGNFERDLARLNAVRAAPGEEEAAAELRQALASRSNFLVARAADIIGEWELAHYATEMVAAFNRFLIDSVRRDPTCAAKYAIADSLNRLEYPDAELFRRGLRHVQPEPVYGGHVDTAARLRAVCALGLARSDPPDTLVELAGLLADKETDARLGAIRAIAYAARPGGGPLLWYKAQIGDSDTSVMFECFAALLALEPERALPFIGGRMQTANQAIAETAALALGVSKLPAALPLLTEGWETARDPAFRRTALISIATLGDDAAFNFLLNLLQVNLLQDGSVHDAADALSALALFRDDERRRRKVERVAHKRDHFPPSC